MPPHSLWYMQACLEPFTGLYRDSARRHGSGGAPAQEPRAAGLHSLCTALEVPGSAHSHIPACHTWLFRQSYCMKDCPGEGGGEGVKSVHSKCSSPTSRFTYCISTLMINSTRNSRSSLDVSHILCKQHTTAVERCTCRLHILHIQ